MIHVLQLLREGIYVCTINMLKKTDDMMENFTSVYRKNTTLARQSEIAENHRKRENSYKKDALLLKDQLFSSGSTEPMETT